MSDGIIQQVIKEFLERQLREHYQQDTLLLDRAEFMELQQELIEKIKQEHIRLSQIFCTCDQHQGKLIGFSVFREQLIGDNNV